MLVDSMGGFFEGPEKKVELAVVDEFSSLRSFGPERWTAVVESARANVVSRERRPRFDAYLLSESSLFVFDSFVTMITCGQTLLVDAVAEMLRFIPAEAIALLIYERKNEHFPEQQPSTFYDDARRLHRWLPGRALRFGADHEHAVSLFHTTRPYEPEPDDTTLEVLMHGIDEARAAEFRAAEPGAAHCLAQQFELEAILPGFTLTDHAFEPAGYSLNATREGLYYTVHVTPQRLGSYVSFETNYDYRSDPSGLVSRVVSRFGPESFDVVAFDPIGVAPPAAVEGYRLRRHVREPLCGYQVDFQHFYRPSTEPGRAMTIELDPSAGC